MDITLNGKKSSIETGTTAADLIAQLGLTGKRLALEVNQDIVRRSEYPQYTLRANDKVEVVHAIGGG
jgi:sulfur carrier protein